MEYTMPSNDRNDCICSCCIAFCLSMGILFITSSLLSLQIFLVAMSCVMMIIITWNCYFIYLHIRNYCRVQKEIRQRIREIELTVIKNGDTCSICLEPCVSGVKLECEHEFHKECIQEWFKTNMSCPNCRLPV